MTLAQKLFANKNLEDELFDRLNEIFGCNTRECLKEGFEWGVLDCFFDWYDESVEIIRPENSPDITKDQAAAICDLGFGKIFDSRGEDGRLYYRNGEYGKCLPKGGDETNRLQATIKALRNDKSK